VEGVTAAASAGITEFVKFVASVDDSQIKFAGSASTFSALGAQADNGIIVDSTIIATSGYMHLDGDMDRDNKGDNNNSIQFADEMTVQAKTFLTLESLTGAVYPTGALTLRAGSGISIYNDITATVEGKRLVFDADYESAGDGILGIFGGKILDSKKGTVIVTAADITFGGSVKTDSMTIHTSSPQGQMALGTLPQNLTVSATDMQGIIADGLMMGNHINGDITVSGITEASSNSVTEIVSIVALGDDARVKFKGVSSTFNTLVVQADNGIDVHVLLTADTGALILNGDVDASNVDDSQNTISFSGESMLRAKGMLYINGTTSGMHRAGAGTLTLQSTTGILLSAGLTSDIDNQDTFINSDDAGGVWSITDTSGIGILTISPPALLRTQDGQLTITASDLDLQGTIDTGQSSLLLTTSRTGSIVRLGVDTADNDNGKLNNGFTVSGTELQRITGAGLQLGNVVNSSIEVDGVTYANSQAISGILSVVATAQNAGISFLTRSSTFSGLAGIADDGIDIEKSITTVTGSITLNGDADDHDDGKSRDHVALIGTGMTLTSGLDINLSGTTGGVRLSGPAVFIAKRHINIINKFTGPFGAHKVTLTSDSDNDGVGTLLMASTACSVYPDAASCVASRICQWCGA
jgi:hypothetical protein